MPKMWFLSYAIPFVVWLLLITLLALSAAQIWKKALQTSEGDYALLCYMLVVLFCLLFEFNLMGCVLGMSAFKPLSAYLTYNVCSNTSTVLSLAIALARAFYFRGNKNGITAVASICAVIALGCAFCSGNATHFLVAAIPFAAAAAMMIIKNRSKLSELAEA